MTKINDENIVDDGASERVGTVIEIDPEKEAACRRRFDMYLLPTSVVFLVLATLDRNNVSTSLILGFYLANH